MPSSEKRKCVLGKPECSSQELFRFDQFYRQFHQAADIAELGGWDVLKTLQAAIEDCYSGWFTDQIALAWDSFLEQGQA